MSLGGLARLAARRSDTVEALDRNAVALSAEEFDALIR
jgi:hypothetical protein